ncbi:hypothetical protein [Nocardioides massiliensis]|uniref:hypothetical protein n=1 Tax=Nocardioides massiliensis TaxID=1325935 RepID=UPI001FEBF2F9|nr:hypothetical protein [Nocardioides massiliensis]
MLWPRPVLLVEADATGGSGILAGYFRGIKSYDQGLVELALSADDVADLLPSAAQPIGSSSAAFIPGPRAHTQAPALASLWAPLMTALQNLETTGQDVIVDCGRLGLVGWPEPVLAEADLSLILCRTHLPAISAARSWAKAVQRGHPAWAHPGAMLVGERQPYSAKEVSSVLGLPIHATVADDPQSAAVLHRGVTIPDRFDRSPLVRSLQAAISAIHAAVNVRRDRLGTEVLSDVQ